MYKCQNGSGGVYVIGLTGGIASGKSTVAAMLRDLGAFVVDADKLAHEAMAPGSPALERIAAVFGPSVMTDDGGLNRRKLADIVFRDKQALSVLNSIVHPVVIARTEEILKELRDRACAKGEWTVCVLDAPLLFEAGADRLADETWVVYVDRHLQIQRLIARENYTVQEAILRIDSQMPLEEKKLRATAVIDNSGDLEDTKRRVLELWQDVRRRIGV